MRAEAIQSVMRPLLLLFLSTCDRSIVLVKQQFFVFTLERLLAFFVDLGDVYLILKCNRGSQFCSLLYTNVRTFYFIFKRSGISWNITSGFAKTILWAHHFWATEEFGIIGSCRTAFKVTNPVLYPLLSVGLNGVFTIKKQ